MTKAPYLLCYDIRERKRLLKVHRVARSYGISVQYSVFYLELNSKEVQMLLADLGSEIDPEEDDIRLYSVYSLKYAEIYGCPLIPADVMLSSALI